MTTRQRRAVAVISWRAVVWLLAAVTGWDAAGLLVGGDHAYASHSYDALRSMVPSMRVYGLLFAVLCLGTVYALGRQAASRHERLMRACLCGIFGVYVLWAAGIVSSWTLLGAPMAWGAISKLLAIAALSAIAARATPAHGG